MSEHYDFPLYLNNAAINKLRYLTLKELSYQSSQETLFCRPYFVHLEFPCHEDAWKAFDILQQRSESGKQYSVDWIKTSVYNTTAKKFREFKNAKPPPESTDVPEGDSSGANKI